MDGSHWEGTFLEEFLQEPLGGTGLGGEGGKGKTKDQVLSRELFIPCSRERRNIEGINGHQVPGELHRAVSGFFVLQGVFWKSLEALFPEEEDELGFPKVWLGFLEFPNAFHKLWS